MKNTELKDKEITLEDAYEIYDGNRMICCVFIGHNGKFYIA